MSIIKALIDVVVGLIKGLFPLWKKEKEASRETVFVGENRDLTNDINKSISGQLQDGPGHGEAPGCSDADNGD